MQAVFMTEAMTTDPRPAPSSEAAVSQTVRASSSMAYDTRAASLECVRAADGGTWTIVRQPQQGKPGSLELCGRRVPAMKQSENGSLGEELDDGVIAYL